jgi:hypothetical protein
MKNAFIIALVAIIVFASCKKDNNNPSYKVKYTVSGSAVNQYKITVDSSDNWVLTPFSGAKDTTIYVAAGTTLKLDAKATGVNALVGSIYVNDALVSTGSDPDTDGDNKTEVKLSYSISK